MLGYFQRPTCWHLLSLEARLQWQGPPHSGSESMADLPAPVPLAAVPRLTQTQEGQRHGCWCNRQALPAPPSARQIGVGS